ncbi:spermatogenesis-associated protein 1-like isoform X10 [Mytilus edulis]|uniref:spermatogenesis-associated protein 1-like isoform X10 n=1 Tax=Mytilus edulis TaxID=6550 RepID=UPI0039EF26EA
MSRQEIFNSYNEGGKMRPSSAELSDLHVYIVPPDLWRERYNNLLNQNVTETISAGIIRVHPETRVCNLRDELETQLGAELLPRDFIFLKSVGRSITRLKPKQEFQLKVKHFLPPNSYAPELYLLEVENRDDENETTGSTRPTTRSPQFTEMLRSFATREDERQSNRYRQKPRNATSPYRYTSPLPKIKSDRGGSQKTVESVTHFDQNGDTDGEKLVTVSNSWGGDTRRSPRRSPQTSRRSPPPRSPPPQNDYSHKQNEYPSQQNDYPPPQNDYPDTSRLNASPTHSGVTDKPVASSHQPVASKYDPRSATYTNQTNDSGIAGLTPEEYRENYDDAERRKNEYNESRQKELENRLNGDRMNGDLDDSDRQRRLREDQEREEWERKNRDEDERRRREEEDRRRREEEERQREEDERRRREEEREKMAREKLSGSDERQLQGKMRKDLNRFPSPPPMNVASTDQDLDSGSQNLTKEQKQAEIPEPPKEPEPEPEPVKEKEKTVIKKKPSFKKKKSSGKKDPEEEKRLLQELEAAREARRAVERQREELVKKAKLMQNKTQNRRNHARDLWKKRYFEEKKRTPPLEEQCNKLRHELDVIHRKLMNALEGSSKDKNTRMENLKPSKQNNYKIQATRLTHEIDDLRRRLENAKMKLTAEMKLRNQAETELRALRAELTQKKIHLTLSRNQQMAMTPGGDSRYYRTPALSNKA